MLRNALVAVVGLGTLATSAAGQLVYLSQDRFVATSQHWGEAGPPALPDQTVIAPDFGPFSGLAETASRLPVGAGNHAIAQQESVLGSGSIVFWGSGFVHSNEAAAGTSFARAESSMTVHFTLSEATAFSLEAASTAVPGAGWPFAEDSAQVTLIHVTSGTTIVDVSVDQFGEPPSDLADFSASGVLEPGEYRYIVAMAREAVRQQNVWGGTSTLEAVLTIPAPGAGVAVLAGALAMARRRR